MDYLEPSGQGLYYRSVTAVPHNSGEKPIQQALVVGKGLLQLYYGIAVMEEYYCNHIIPRYRLYSKSIVGCIFATVWASKRLNYMQTTLVLSEIVFYFTVSFVLIGAGVLGAIITYRLVKIARELEGLSHNLKSASSEAGERIDEVVRRLSELPVFSYFLKPRSGRDSEKGRRKLDNNKHNEEKN